MIKWITAIVAIIGVTIALLQYLGISPNQVLTFIKSKTGHDTYLTVNNEKAEVSVTLSGAKEKFHISANKDYNVTDLPSWCSVEKKSSDSFILKCDSNPDTSSRSHLFKVTSGNRIVKTTVIQSGISLSKNEHVCSVKGVVGDVKVNRRKVRREEAVKGGIAAQVNMVLREKDVIQTSAQSEIKFETPDGSVIELGENTTLEIYTLRHNPRASNTKMKLVGGSMVANVKKSANNRSTFEIQTPTATIVVPGAIVELDMSGELTEIKVFNGNARVAPVGSRRFIDVGDRQAVDIAPRQRKLAVKEVSKDYKLKNNALLTTE